MHADYKQIFKLRGAPYDKAMQSWPTARVQEFERLFDRAPIGRAEQVVDFPAGGGYLRAVLPCSVDYVPLELTEGFGANVSDIVSFNGKWPVSNADRLVCLAALHHMDDHQGAIESLISRVKPGGLVHIADVDAASPVARFLDEFVGAYNGMGHEGRYLSVDKPLQISGASIERWKVIDCPWEFDSLSEAANFCYLVFGLSGVSEDEILTALDHYIGLDQNEERVQILWHLLYADLRRNAPMDSCN